MQPVAGWLLVGMIIAAAYPSAAWLTLYPLHVRERGEARTLSLCLTLALAFGALTLLMFWMGLLGLALTVTNILPLYLLLMLPGAWRYRRDVRHQRLVVLPSPGDDLPPLLRALPLAVAAAACFNAVYWPFYRDDTLGIYAPAAQAMYETGTLVPLTGADSLYRTYPMLVPLTYTFAYAASGWPNEYLAGGTAALLSVGCLPAVWLLGRRLGGVSAGSFAVLLLALTPAFGRWASSGYVDLPMAFFYTLAAYFALRLWTTQAVIDALLAGVCMGLAAWTKNAALLGVVLLAVWLLWALVCRRITIGQALLSLAVCAIIAAPWYVRNWLGAGFLVPSTAWIDQAQRTPANLLIFLTRTEYFGFPGWVMMIGLIAALVRLARRHAESSGDALLLLWTIPFFGAWWWFVSYDPRFLLLFSPLLCALGGGWLSRRWLTLPQRARPLASAAGMIIALMLTALIVYQSIEYKDDMLRDPLMSDAAKRAIVRGE